jgi:O-antigen/teichoic acid export membrane protein
MIGTPAAPSSALPAATAGETVFAGEDLSGRHRITRNVVTSWASHAVVIASGFLIPRMISDGLGQATLGVWDFCWSLVAYFGLVQGSVVSSINRYVALHRATGDQVGVNRAVSSVTCVLLVMAGTVTLLSAVTVAVMPAWWGPRLGPHVGDAQWVVLLLGLALAFQIACAGYGGVVTGCHRWDVHNALYAGVCLVVGVLMIAVILLGGGLPALAGVYLGGEAVGRWFWRVAAYRVCPGLRVRPRLASWTTARQMLGFGAKTFVPSLGQLLLNQTVSLLIVGYLGPAVLAVYSRPLTLVRHISTLVAKFAFVVTPTASSLQAAGNSAEVRRFAVAVARFGSLMALPMLLSLALLGGPVLRLWMGPAYALDQLALILALGHLVTTAQQPLLCVLCGLNAHGRPGLANFCASLGSVGLVFASLHVSRPGVEIIALSVVLPITAVNLVYLPLHTGRMLGLSVREYLRNVWIEPVLYCLPFTACLILARGLMLRSALATMAVGMFTGTIALAVVYWHFAVPARLKAAVLARVGWTPPVGRVDCSV